MYSLIHFQLMSEHEFDDWESTTEHGSNFVVSLWMKLWMEEAAETPGMGGTVTVYRRLLAQRDFGNYVISLTKVQSRIQKTKKQPKDRCRELYSVLAQELNAGLNSSRLQNVIITVSWNVLRPPQACYMISKRDLSKKIQRFIFLYCPSCIRAGGNEHV